MSEDNPKTWNRAVEHPSEDDLLCFIDGELSQREGEKLRSHLEACWDCRNRAEKFESAISLFVDYRKQVFQPLIEAPNHWGGFSSKLQGQAISPVPLSFWERWRAALSRLRVMLPQVEPRNLRLTAISAMTVLIVVAGAYFVFISGPAVVSAEELIERAYASRAAEIKSADQPVLYQQLRIKRRTANGETAANIEIWQDIDNLRMRKVVTPQKDDANAPVISDLEKILRANDYEPPPLSIVGFRRWRDALTEKRDSVEKLNTDDGTAAIRLQTDATTAPHELGRIISSQLIVRANDYHPLEQYFRVATADGEQEFEVREASFAVMSLNSLNPGFFADSTPMIVSGRPSPGKSESPEASSESNESVSGAEANTRTASQPNGIATGDLEVEILNLLHGAGADLGEQIEVRRTPNGPITISGVVETPERKSQILNALGSVKDNPAVRIQIATVAEYLAQQKQGKPTPRPSTESVEVEGDTFPAEADLRARLKDDGAVKAFASRTIGRSSAAMNYLWAMKRLKGQFSLAQLEQLTPEARAKWLGVVRSYARSYQGEIASLRRDLAPVFGGAGGGSTAGAINSDADLLSAIDQLFAAGSGANQMVRSSLAASSAGVNTLKTPQFWQQLARAEGLAAAIERAK